MRKLIVIVLVLLVVAGGGAGGLVMLGVVHNPFKHAPPQLDAVAQAAAVADAKAKASAFDMPIAALPIVKIGDLLVPVLTTDGTGRQIFVTCRLITDAPDKAKVTAEVSKYVDAVLSDLIPYFQDYFRSHDMVDLAVLKKKLNRHAHEQFGDAVKEVLLVNVFESGAGTGAKPPVADDSD
ncbi:MAG: hypothetical protein EPO08_17615 [Rhodospirillaceae bacterium]|nr:MAG: hypothetical protein EPO08_17615 [Rhodospirillaceae bacterium]